MTTLLDRRYRRLLRAYPAAYRAERGDELVNTYLDTVGSGRRWPNARDVADVLAGGARQHLRARDSSGLPGGVSIAAVLALGTGSMLATVWLVAIELAPIRSSYQGSDPFAPFRSSSAYVWLAWLAAAVIFAAGSGRWCRRLIAFALVLTVVAKPVAWLAVGDWAWYARSALENWGQYGFATNPATPSGIALAPMGALAVIALAVPSRPGRVARWAPVVAVAAPIYPSLQVRRAGYWNYAELASRVFEWMAPMLLAAVVVVMLALLVRRDPRARWVPLVLLTPLVLFLVDPIIRLALPLVMGQPWDAPFWYERATVSILLALLSVGVLVLAIAITGRRRKPGAADGTARA